MSPVLFISYLLPIWLVLIFFGGSKTGQNTSSLQKDTITDFTPDYYIDLGLQYKEEKDLNTFSFLLNTAAYQLMEEQKFKEADSLLKYTTDILSASAAVNKYQLYQINYARALNYSNWYIPDSAETYWNIVINQLESSRQLEKADILNKKAYLYRAKKLNVQAIKLYEEAINIYLKYDTTGDLLGSTYNNLAISLSNSGEFTSAIDNYQLALKYNIEYCPDITPMIAQIKYNIGINNLNEGNYEEGKSTLTEVINNTRNNPELRKQFFLANDQLAGLYKKIGHYTHALKIYNENIELMKQYSDDPVSTLANAYMKAGLIYQDENNSQRALEYFQKAEQLLEEYKNKPHIPLGFLYSYMGTSYLKSNDLKSALECYMNEYKIMWAMLGENNISMAHRNINLARVYSKLSYKDSTDYYLNKSVEIVNNYSELSQSKVIPLRRIALLYQEQEDWFESIRYLSEAYDITKNINSTGIERAEVIYLLSKSYFHINDLPRALRYLKELENISSYYNLQFRIKSLLGDIFYSIYLENNEVEYLIECYNNYNEAANLMGEQRNYYNSDDAINEIATRVRALHEKLLLVCYELYSISKNPEYINTAYEIIDKNKSAALIESVKLSKVKNNLGLPDSILDHEIYLKNEINFYSIELDKAKDRKDIEKVNQYRDQLFKINLQYDQLKELIRNKYGNYYMLIDNDRKYSLDEMKRKIKEDELIINYFYGSDHIYSFSIFKDTVTYLRIDKTENLISTLNDYLVEISTAPLQNTNNLIINSQKLYQLLVQPSIKKNIYKLTIIPDKLLSYLPFEALLDQDNRYLVENYSISYNYSSDFNNTIYNSKENNLYSYLGFSSSYNNTKISDLNYSVNEVIDSKKLLEGKIFIDEKATKDNFMKQAGNFKIVHCALHGEVNPNIPLDSKLLFTKENNEFELKSAEILNMKLNADLIILSSCNTGLGKHEEGDGIMHLARSFAYAGCKSAIMSYWNVSDYSTNKIVQEFILNLKKGISKDRSLQIAKIKYLNNTEDPLLKHPYYWAALVPIGDMQPIIFQNKDKVQNINKLIVYVFFSIVILFALIFIAKK